MAVETDPKVIRLLLKLGEREAQLKEIEELAAEVLEGDGGVGKGAALQLILSIARGEDVPNMELQMIGNLRVLAESTEKVVRRSENNTRKTKNLLKKVRADLKKEKRRGK